MTNSFMQSKKLQAVGESFDRKMLLALYSLFSLRLAVVVTVGALVLIAILYVFSLLLSVLVSVVSTLAATYVGCSSLEKLFFLILVGVTIRMLSPVAMRLFGHAEGSSDGRAN